LFQAAEKFVPEKRIRPLEKMIPVGGRNLR